MKFSKFLFSKLIILFYLLSTLSIIGLAGFIIIDSYKSYSVDVIERIKLDKINSRKELTKDRVENIIHNLEFNNEKVEEYLKRELKHRVDEAFWVIEKRFDFLSTSKESIKEILRDIRWDNGNGYFFIDDINGTCLLYPIRKELEGKNISSIKDINGKYVIKDFINISLTKKEGYSSYYTSKPKSSKIRNYKKISYVRYFEPYNWIVGTGAYVDEFKDKLKLDLIDKLKRFNSVSDNNSNLFILDLFNINGGENFAKILVHPNENYYGEFISDSKLDSNKQAYRKKYLKILREDGKGFASFYYKKPNSDIEVPSIMYFSLFKDWDWVIVIGIYLDDIEKEYENEINNLNIEIEETIYFYIYIFIILAILAFLISSFFFWFQKRALEDRNKRVKESERQFKSMFYKNSAVMLLVDPRSRKIVDSNLSAREYYGYSKAELELKKISDINITTTFNENINDVVKFDKKYFITKHKLSDETVKDVEVHSTTINIKGKNLLFSIIHDITDRVKFSSELKSTTEELKELNKTLENRVALEVESRVETQEKFKEITDATFDGILTVDKNMSIQTWNRACEDIFGFDEKSVKNRELFNFIPFNERGKRYFYLSFIRKYLLNKRVLEFSFESINKKRIFIEASFSFSKIDKRDYLIAIIRNITDKKLAEFEKIEIQKRQISQEQLLIQQSKMAELGEMVGAISHQWKQPLNSIALLAQSMEDEHDVEEMENMVDLILKQVNFMSHTITDFRDFFKPSKEKSSFSVKDSINSIVELIVFQFNQKNISIITESIDFDDTVLGYENEFKQVILNILNNAKDALDSESIKNGEIRISFENSKDKITIFIDDNAGGIDESILENIFNAFVSTKGDNGTGIGLYMSKIIVDNMDGEIEAVNIEAGARFIIKLKRV